MGDSTGTPRDDLTVVYKIKMAIRRIDEIFFTRLGDLELKCTKVRGKTFKGDLMGKHFHARG